MKKLNSILKKKPIRKKKPVAKKKIAKKKVAKKKVAKKKPVAKKKVGAVVKDPKYMAQYHNAITQINASQKVLDEISLRMKLRPHPAMKLQMKDSQAKIKKYIREMKTHARELKKLI